MNVQILGPGCPNCLALEANARKAVEELKIKAEIEHVFDINKMVEMGMIMSPGLAIDGELVSQGKILSVEEIKNILKSKSC